MVVQNLQPQNVGLALRRRLRIKQMPILHGHADNRMVIPQVVAPIVRGRGGFEGGHEVDAPGVQPDAWRLARANPDLVDFKRDAVEEVGGCVVGVEEGAPGGWVGDCGLLHVPDVVLVYGGEG